MITINQGYSTKLNLYKLPGLKRTGEAANMTECLAISEQWQFEVLCLVSLSDQRIP